MSTKDLLASMQALLVYILMRIMAGPTSGEEQNAEDVGPQLIITINVSARTAEPSLFCEAP
jgi:hypothetical protein